jgi:GxxExxY protein
MIIRQENIASDSKRIYKDLTEIIIGCAYKIYHHFGFGYLESVYDKALIIELAANNLINFGEEKVEVKRKYKERKHPENHIDPV